MDLSVFARGFGLGFSIAAVLGPIGVLCLRRSLVSGFRFGFVSGLGAATADATYAAVAAFGVSTVASLLVDQRFWFRLIGGAFLATPKGFIPQEDQGQIQITLEASQGISLQEMMRHELAAMNIVMRNPNVATFFARKILWPMRPTSLSIKRTKLSVHAASFALRFRAGIRRGRFMRGWPRSRAVCRGSAF